MYQDLLNTLRLLGIKGLTIIPLVGSERPSKTLSLFYFQLHLYSHR